MKDTVVIEGEVTLTDTIDGEVAMSSLQDGQSHEVYNYGTVVDVDYEKHVYNRPSIEQIELVGNRTMKQLGVDTLSVQDIEKILYLD